MPGPDVPMVDGHRGNARWTVRAGSATTLPISLTISPLGTQIRSVVVIVGHMTGVGNGPLLGPGGDVARSRCVTVAGPGDRLTSTAEVGLPALRPGRTPVFAYVRATRPDGSQAPGIVSSAIPIGTLIVR
jgi:hypothetical protein